MKKIIFLGMLFLGIQLVNAQNYQPTPLEQIQQEKQLKTSFKKVTLFSKTTLQKAGITLPSEFKNYTLLDVYVDQLKGFQKNAPQTFELQVPTKKTPISLELVKVKITSDDFKIIQMPSGKEILDESPVVHYRGIIKGIPNSIAAISIIGDEVSGVVSSDKEKGNFVIAKLENSKNHIFYSDNDLNHLNDFACNTIDNGETYTKEHLSYNSNSKVANPCPEVFIDIANDIVNNKGGAQNASNYIRALFNQVAVLYANENINIKLSGLKAWTSQPPFSIDLNAYRNYRNNNGFNGDVGHLVTYGYSGGIAWVGAVCGSYKYGLSGIQSNFSNVPTYSWSVMVIAHELGHNFGSNHTQKCVWNGNNTAIDGCVATEGGCPRPAAPSGGGTIMSYCHLSSVGINFNNGFGNQPGNVIRNTLRNKSCVANCNGGGGGTDWTQIDGLAQEITVDNAGKAWIANESGNLYVRINNNSWQYVRNNVQDAGAGSKLGITDRQDRIFYKNTNNNNFYELGGKGQKIDVDNKGNAWLINSVGNIYQRNGNSWNNKQGPKAIDIGCSAANGGGIFIVAQNGQIYKRNNNNWNLLPGSNGKRIDADNRGGAWLVNSSGNLYRYTPNNNRWNYVRKDVKDVGCSSNGDVWVTLTNDQIMKWNGNTNGLSAAPEELIATSIAQESDIQVYPNPADDLVFINITNLTNQITKISVIDTRGRVVKSISKISNSPTQELDVHTIPKGIYFLQVHAQQQKITKKLIIN